MRGIYQCSRLPTLGMNDLARTVAIWGDKIILTLEDFEYTIIFIKRADGIASHHTNGFNIRIFDCETGNLLKEYESVQIEWHSVFTKALEDIDFSEIHELKKQQS